VSPRVAVASTKFEKAWPASDRSEYEILDLETALARVYTTDAHLVTCVVQTIATHQPRLRKASVGDYPLPVTTNVLFADVDNPSHAEWTPELLSALDGVLQTEGLYLTKRGYRLVQPLVEPVPTRDVEPVLVAWLESLRARIGPGVDMSCRDWTRHFRLPHVRREGKPYASPRVDLSRMVPIHVAPAPLAPPVPRVRTAKPRIAEPASYAVALDNEWAARAARVGSAVRDEGGVWHPLFLALAGALLERGAPPELLPAIVRGVSLATGADTETHDREKLARSTVQVRASGGAVTGYGTLRRRWPLVADALDFALAPPQTEVAARQVVMPPPRDGVQLVAAECGMGKTRAARALAKERSLVRAKDPNATGARAPAGSKTAISVDKNALAIQVAADLRADGVAVRRVFGALSVDGADECKLKSYAEPMVGGGQSLRVEFCEGRNRARCPHYAGCKAREGVEGDAGARVTVGPHALIAELAEAAGPTGLLVIDEPESVLESVLLTAGDLDTALRHIDMFALEYGAAMRDILGALHHWADGGREPDAGGMRARVPSEVRPPIQWMHVARARGHLQTARALGTASRVCRDVQRVLRVPGATMVLDVGGLVLTIPNERLVKVLQREGQTVVMAADVELHAPLYAAGAVLGYQPPLTRFSAPDGAPIARTLFRTRASRTHWVRPAKGGEAPESFRAAVRRVLAWADGASLGIVTYAALEDIVRTMVPPGVHVAHYGAMRGLDGWKDLDALATLGDPRPNLSMAEREADFGGVDAASRVDALARAELEQAHGRLRTIHRTKPGKACHVGEVMPGGSGWAPGKVEIVEVTGRPSRVPVGPESLLEMVQREGKAAVAERLGVSLQTLNSRLRKQT
jgi:hypothetical protein